MNWDCWGMAGSHQLCIRGRSRGILLGRKSGQRDDHRVPEDTRQPRHCRERTHRGGVLEGAVNHAGSVFSFFAFASRIALTILIDDNTGAAGGIIVRT